MQSFMFFTLETSLKSPAFLPPFSVTLNEIGAGLQSTDFFSSSPGRPPSLPSSALLSPSFANCAAIASWFLLPAFFEAGSKGLLSPKLPITN